MTSAAWGTTCAGVVLAGGASSRMGTDKALIPWQGVPLARHMAATLAEAGCAPVVQIGGDAATGVAVVADRHPGQGPLGGVLTACAELGAPWLMVAACDLGLLRPATVRRLLRRAITAQGAQVVVATTDGVQPMCAVWRRGEVRSTLERLWDDGERSLRGVLGHLAVEYVAVPAADLVNLNTPDDVLRAGTVGTMVEEITVQELSELMSGGITLIDVREPDEYASGHAPGAVLMPLGSVLAGEVTIEASGPVYMICRSGARSMRACETLHAQGIAAVNVAGGTMAWVASGYGVVEGMEPS